MKTIVISAAILSFMAFALKGTLTGRWESQPSVNGNTTSVVFKTDSSFEGFINKKPFVSGKYSFEEGILSFTDNGCDGKKGVYKIDFFSNNDSLRFVPVNDSCDQRKQGMSRLIMGRVK
jgi:hypothetical protein